MGVGVRGFTPEPVCVRGRGCSLLLTRGYATQPKTKNSPPSPLVGGKCLQTWFTRGTCELQPPLPQTQPELIFRTSAEFGFLYRDIFLPQICLLPRSEIAGQLCHVKTPSSLRWRNSQSEVPGRRHLQRGLGFSGCSFFVPFCHNG